LNRKDHDKWTKATPMDPCRDFFGKDLEQRIAEFFANDIGLELNLVRFDAAKVREY